MDRQPTYRVHYLFHAFFLLFWTLIALSYTRNNTNSCLHEGMNMERISNTIQIKL